MKALLTLSILLATPALHAQSPWLPEAEQVRLKKSYWPKGVDFPEGAKFYDESTMPPAYQDFDGARGMQGVHSPSYNISAVRSEPFGNANLEFPWKVTAGLHESGNWLARKFAVIPGPILWWKEPQAYRWRFPEKTIFGEMLLVRGRDGYDNCFEVRMRERKPNGEWEPTTYRPFLTGMKMHTEKAAWRIKGHDIDAHVELVELPEIKDAALWLSLPFKQSRQAFTTKSDNSIVPRNYLGSITDCVKCHRQTQLAARGIDSSRHWYGLVRGDDQIFSFHIFDTSCISPNGIERRVILNKALDLKHWQ